MQFHIECIAIIKLKWNREMSIEHTGKFATIRLKNACDTQSVLIPDNNNKNCFSIVCSMITSLPDPILHRNSNLFSK